MIDASALLCLLRREPGSERVVELLPGSMMSVVNLTETYEVLRRKGLPVARSALRSMLDDAQVELICPTAATMEYAADMMAATPPEGASRISLGDGFCLGHAVENGISALTADKTWTQFQFAHPVSIELVR